MKMRILSEHEVRVLMATLQARRIEAAEAYIGTPDLDESSEDYWGGYMHGLDRAIAIAQNLINHSIDTPPTGYDVYCAQDAPAFEHWERVAASVKDVNFVSELLDGAEDWASDIQWDNDEYTEARLVSNQYPRIHRQPVLRHYRILPAGSPPPGNEVSK